MPSAEQQLIKNKNQKALFELIRLHPGISRAGLARSCGLSKPAVSDLTSSLIDLGFIYDTGISESGAPGRKPNGLELRAGSHFVIVVLFEESCLQIQAVDICGFTAYKCRYRKEEGVGYPTLSKLSIDKLFPSLFEKNQICGICFVIPAMIDPARETVYTTSVRMTEKESADLIPELKLLFPEFPVAVLNDTACLAYSEKIYTPVIEKDFVFINFDRGIGASIFLDGEILGRASASYTQFGHYTSAPDGPVCSCGNKGCLERMIGEASLPFSYRELGESAAAGNNNSCCKIREMASYFASALVNLVCIVHPKLIILGGSGKNLGKLFLKEINALISSSGFRPMMDSLKLCYSTQDQDSLFKGAMKYFFDSYYNFTLDTVGSFYIG